MNTINHMRTTQGFAISSLAAALLLGLGGCAGMSAQDRNTVVGAGVGAIGLELPGRGEGQARDSGQHGARLVAHPVGAAHALQFESPCGMRW